jgi:hypothetical protein
VGKLKVKLDKPFYTPGETINGVLYLELEDSVDVDKVYVKIKGKEKVEWEEVWYEQLFETRDDGEKVPTEKEEHVNEYDEKESFFKKKVVILPDGDTTLGAGKYAFPFQLELPERGKKGSKLPGSFAIKQGHDRFGWRNVRGQTRKLKAKIEYSLKAVVDLDDSKDLEYKMDITMFPERPETIATPSDTKDASVMFCCCINRGDLTMSATIDKNVYAPGETAHAILTVDNRSALEVTAMVELNRILRLKADGHHITDRREYHLGRFDTIAPGEEKTVKMEFKIPNMLPTTDGRGVDCVYVLDIVSELQCAPDIELHFPINVFSAPVLPEAYVDGLGDLGEYAIAGTCRVEDMPVKPGYA